MHISFSRYSCNKFSLISVLTYFILLVVFDTLYIIWILITFIFHKNPQFLIILHPVQLLQHNLNHTIKIYFANNNCCTKSTSVYAQWVSLLRSKELERNFRTNSALVICLITLYYCAVPKGGFFSESAIRFSNLPVSKKKIFQKYYPELEIRNVI